MAAILALAVLTLGHWPTLDIKGLLADAKAHDKKVVTLRAEVKVAENRVSRAGKPYFVVTVQQAALTVDLFGYGKLEPLPKPKAKVQATGVFWIERKVGTRVFKNEIVIRLMDKPSPFKILP